MNGSSRWFTTAALFVGALLVGCDKNTSQPPARSQNVTPQESVSVATDVAGNDRRKPTPDAPPRDWTKPIVCQPRLRWSDGDVTHQGTGFFAKAGDGRIAAVSSSHFLDFEGPSLEQAAWLDSRREDDLPRAVFKQSWGVPGRDNDGQNLENDYWIMPVSEAEAAAVAKEFEVLELDEREFPDDGEPVWLPNKSPGERLGFRPVEGKVVAALRNLTLIQLEGPMKLQSQSGSPIISRRTHRVIGTLSRGGEIEGKMQILIAPMTRVRQLLAKPEGFRPLAEVVGKK
jgi:hypothetical protein